MLRTLQSCQQCLSIASFVWIVDAMKTFVCTGSMTLAFKNSHMWKQRACREAASRHAVAKFVMTISPEHVPLLLQTRFFRKHVLLVFEWTTNKNVHNVSKANTRTNIVQCTVILIAVCSWSVTQILAWLDTTVRTVPKSISRMGYCSKELKIYIFSLSNPTGPIHLSRQKIHTALQVLLDLQLPTCQKVQRKAVIHPCLATVPNLLIASHKLLSR